MQHTLITKNMFFKILSVLKSNYLDYLDNTCFIRHVIRVQIPELPE